MPLLAGEEKEKLSTRKPAPEAYRVVDDVDDDDPGPSRGGSFFTYPASPYLLEDVDDDDDPVLSRADSSFTCLASGFPVSSTAESTTKAINQWRQDHGLDISSLAFLDGSIDAATLALARQRASGSQAGLASESAPLPIHIKRRGDRYSVTIDGRDQDAGTDEDAFLRAALAGKRQCAPHDVSLLQLAELREEIVFALVDNPEQEAINAVMDLSTDFLHPGTWDRRLDAHLTQIMPTLPGWQQALILDDVLVPGEAAARRQGLRRDPRYPQAGKDAMQRPGLYYFGHLDPEQEPPFGEDHQKIRRTLANQRMLALASFESMNTDDRQVLVDVYLEMSQHLEMRQFGVVLEGIVALGLGVQDSQPALERLVCGWWNAPADMNDPEDGCCERTLRMRMMQRLLRAYSLAPPQCEMLLDYVVDVPYSQMLERLLRLKQLLQKCAGHGNDTTGYRAAILQWEMECLVGHDAPRPEASAEDAMRANMALLMLNHLVPSALYMTSSALIGGSSIVNNDPGNRADVRTVPARPASDNATRTDGAGTGDHQSPAARPRAGWWAALFGGAAYIAIQGAQEIEMGPLQNGATEGGAAGSGTAGGSAAAAESGTPLLSPSGAWTGGANPIRNPKRGALQAIMVSAVALTGFVAGFIATQWWNRESDATGEKQEGGDPDEFVHLLETTLHGVNGTHVLPSPERLGEASGAGEYGETGTTEKPVPSDHFRFDLAKLYNFLKDPASAFGLADTFELNGQLCYVLLPGAPSEYSVSVPSYRKLNELLDLSDPFEVVDGKYRPRYRMDPSAGPTNWDRLLSGINIPIAVEISAPGQRGKTLKVKFFFGHESRSERLWHWMTLWLLESVDRKNALAQQRVFTGILKDLEGEADFLNLYLRNRPLGGRRSPRIRTDTPHIFLRSGEKIALSRFYSDESRDAWTLNLIHMSWREKDAMLLIDFGRLVDNEGNSIVSEISEIKPGQIEGAVAIFSFSFALRNPTGGRKIKWTILIHHAGKKIVDAYRFLLTHPRLHHINWSADEQFSGNSIRYLEDTQAPLVPGYTVISETAERPDLYSQRPEVLYIQRPGQGSDSINIRDLPSEVGLSNAYELVNFGELYSRKTGEKLYRCDGLVSTVEDPAGDLFTFEFSVLNEATGLSQGWMLRSANEELIRRYADFLQFGLTLPPMRSPEDCLDPIVLLPAERNTENQPIDLRGYEFSPPGKHYKVATSHGGTGVIFPEILVNAEKRAMIRLDESKENGPDLLILRMVVNGHIGLGNAEHSITVEIKAPSSTLMSLKDALENLASSVKNDRAAWLKKKFEENSTAPQVVSVIALDGELPWIALENRVSTEILVLSLADIKTEAQVKTMLGRYPLEVRDGMPRLIYLGLVDGAHLGFRFHRKYHRTVNLMVQVESEYAATALISAAERDDPLTTWRQRILSDSPSGAGTLKNKPLIPYAKDTPVRHLYWNCAKRSLHLKKDWTGMMKLFPEKSDKWSVRSSSDVSVSTDEAYTRGYNMDGNIVFVSHDLKRQLFIEPGPGDELVAEAIAAASEPWHRADLKKNLLSGERCHYIPNHVFFLEVRTPEVENMLNESSPPLLDARLNEYFSFLKSVLPEAVFASIFGTQERFSESSTKQRKENIFIGLDIIEYQVSLSEITAREWAVVAQRVADDWTYSDWAKDRVLLTTRQGRRQLALLFKLLKLGSTPVDETEEDGGAGQARATTHQPAGTDRSVESNLAGNLGQATQQNENQQEFQTGSPAEITKDNLDELFAQTDFLLKDVESSVPTTGAVAQAGLRQTLQGSPPAAISTEMTTKSGTPVDETEEDGGAGQAQATTHQPAGTDRSVESNLAGNLDQATQQNENQQESQTGSPVEITKDDLDEIFAQADFVLKNIDLSMPATSPVARAMLRQTLRGSTLAAIGTEMTTRSGWARLGGGIVTVGSLLALQANFPDNEAPVVEFDFPSSVAWTSISGTTGVALSYAHYALFPGGQSKIVVRVEKGAVALLILSASLQTVSDVRAFFGDSDWLDSYVIAKDAATVVSALASWPDGGAMLMKFIEKPPAILAPASELPLQAPVSAPDVEEAQEINLVVTRQHAMRLAPLAEEDNFELTDWAVQEEIELTDLTEYVSTSELTEDALSLSDASVLAAVDASEVSAHTAISTEGIAALGVSWSDEEFLEEGYIVFNSIADARAAYAALRAAISASGWEFPLLMLIGRFIVRSIVATIAKYMTEIAVASAILATVAEKSLEKGKLKADIRDRAAKGLRDRQPLDTSMLSAEQLSMVAAVSKEIGDKIEAEIKGIEAALNNCLAKNGGWLRWASVNVEDGLGSFIGAMPGWESLINSLADKLEDHIINGDPESVEHGWIRRHVEDALNSAGTIVSRAWTYLEEKEEALEGRSVAGCEKFVYDLKPNTIIGQRPESGEL